MNKTKNWIQTYIKEIEITTTHRYQVRETEIVMVILKKYPNDNNSIDYDRHYLISALTRATSKMILIFIDH